MLQGTPTIPCYPLLAQVANPLLSPSLRAARELQGAPNNEISKPSGHCAQMARRARLGKSQRCHQSWQLAVTMPEEPLEPIHNLSRGTYPKRNSLNAVLNLEAQNAQEQGSQSCGPRFAHLGGKKPRFRLDLALKCGASRVLNVSNGNATEKLRRAKSRNNTVW